MSQDILNYNVCTFSLIKLPVHDLSKIWTYLYWPMVHRCKKCDDISKLTSGGRAEIKNVKSDRPSDLHFNLCQHMLLLKCYYGVFGKKASCWILKILFISWITGQSVQRMCGGPHISMEWYLEDSGPGKQQPKIRKGQNIDLLDNIKDSWS